MTTMRFRPGFWWLLALVLGALLPWIIPDPYIRHLLILCCFYVVLTLSLNLLVGFSGQTSFAHAAFFGVGAYTSAILTTRYGVSFWIGLPAAGLMATFISLLIAIPSLRLRGPYLAIATIGFQEIVVIVLSQWTSVTRGPMGITSIPKPQIGSFVIRTLPHWYLLAFALVVLTVIVMFRISRSRIGLELIALREDEVAARAMGVNTYKMKVLAFTVSSLIAGLAGSIYAHYINSIDPYSFMIGLSATVLVMVLAGGVGSIVGSILSAVGLTLLPEFLRQFTSAGLRMVLFGAALVAVILFMPEGFAGVARQIRERRWKRGKPLPEEGAVAEAAGAAVPPSRTLEAEHE